MFTINVPRGRKLSRCLEQPLHVMDGGKMKHIKSAFERPFVVTGAGGKAVVGASNGVVLALVPIQNYEGARGSPYCFLRRPPTPRRQGAAASRSTAAA